MSADTNSNAVVFFYSVIKLQLCPILVLYSKKSMENIRPVLEKLQSGSTQIECGITTLLFTMHYMLMSAEDGAIKQATCTCKV